ncbi:sensor histidine kinase [Arenivirga flava]|uniref:histidine kinase n=1 Tax=Arenivirga flava TaxID=1930060 RepID=A0AA37XC08_9MICO|nr:ATP-binding protein [Arenivirga flava]GMA29266.1 two-component sensor histidine kinase [Arenivirga flava]
MTTEAPRRRVRWTLRRRLVVSIVALLAVLGAAIGTVSVVTLESVLVSRFDQQLAAAVALSRDNVGPYGYGGSLPSADELLARQPLGTIAVIDSEGYGMRGFIVAPKGASVGTADQMELALHAARDGQPVSTDLGGELGEYRLLAATTENGDSLVVGLPMRDVNATAAALTTAIVLVILAGLILAAIAATVIVRLALRPLQRVAETVSHVAELPLDRGEVALSVRVPEGDTDPGTEVGQVGAAVNRMLGHIGSALEARQASENKVRRFVADASHELRTPLASIRGYSELTRRGGHELPDDVVYSIGRIESESLRMTELVEDLLLLARLDEGREIRRAEVDLTALLIDAVSDAQAAGPDHVWQLDLPEEPLTVTGDGPRLQQVVVNLLTNARVHTPEGTTVRVGLRADADEVVVSVADDGPGIPEGILPSLFERFVRGDASRSRKAGSSGLGLAIAAAIVQAHHGRIDVDFEPGATEFRMALPAG